MGHHENCSNFCTKLPCEPDEADKQNSSSTEDQSSGDCVDNCMSDLVVAWTETTDQKEEAAARLQHKGTVDDIDPLLRSSVLFELDKLANKAQQLIGNFTTNLAEGWMSIRCKFDGGKHYNRCHRGSWHARCYGAGLRSALGATWSPIAWKRLTGRVPYMACLKFYNKQKRRREIERACKSKPEMRQKRMKRKYQRSVESSQKKAKLSYGKDALVVEPDYDSAVLKDRCQSFYEQNVVATPAKIKYVEESSRLQSESGVWHAERRVRLTASNFGRIFTRQRKNNLAPLIKSVIH
jgi:hypothetical protein